MELSYTSGVVISMLLLTSCKTGKTDLVNSEVVLVGTRPSESAGLR